MNALLIACFFMLSAAPVIADDDDKPVAELPGSSVGQGRIFLSAKAQSVSGLQTEMLIPVSDHPEFTAYGDCKQKC